MSGIWKMVAIITFTVILLALSAPTLSQQTGRSMASPASGLGSVGSTHIMIPVEQSNRDIMTTLMSMGNLNTSMRMMESSGIERVMKSGSHTIFVPGQYLTTNKNVSQFQTSSVVSEPETTKNVIKGLITNGMVMPGEIAQGRSITMLNGKTMTVSSKNGVLMLGGSKITRAIQATNGMIYVIDSMPPQAMDIPSLKK